MKYSWQTKAMFVKPCPFCGSKNLVIEKKDSFYDSNKSCTYVECAECGVHVYGDGVLGGTTYNEAVHNAIERWNRRVA